MRLSRFLAIGAGAMLSTGLAAAQELNEIFVSHCGTDDMEFVEIVGTPGTSLTGYVIAVVEGDNFMPPGMPPAPAGTLDEIIDLTGQVIPASGYFVAGNTAVANVNLDIGPDNILENGTNTYYLIRSSTPGVLVNLAGTDVDADDDGITELLTGDPGVISFEAVGMVDGGFGPGLDDIVYDCAAVLGPELGGGACGPFLPPGLYRPADSSTGWCDGEWLDFSVPGCSSTSCPAGIVQTPGVANPASTCATVPSTAGCNPSGPIGTNYCGPAVPNSTGNPGVISANGSTAISNNLVTLTASGLPPGQFGYFLAGQTQGFFNPPGSSGFICLTGNIGRYNGAADIITGPMGSIAIDLNSIPVNPPAPVQSGETWSFQCWYRDIGNSSNFTDGIEILFL